MLSVTLFIVGRGMIAKALLARLAAAPSGVQYAIAGIARSTGGWLDQSGVDSDSDPPLTLSRWYDAIASQVAAARLEGDLSVPVVVDCSTAGPEISSCYQGLLKKRIAVVTCNKRPVVHCTSEEFRQFELSARSGNPAFFRMGATVGAGTRLLRPLAEVVEIGIKPRTELVISGTFNLILARMAEGRSLRQAFDEALAAGMVEPRYIDDIGADDPAWKVTLAGRVLGDPVTLQDVQRSPLVPVAPTASNDEVLAAIDAHGEEVAARVREILSRGEKPRYMGWWEEDVPHCGIRGVGPEHPAFSLAAGTNMVIMWHQHFGSQPLVTSGAGAGADSTVHGVLSDVLEAARLTAQRMQDLSAR